MKAGFDRSIYEEINLEIKELIDNSNNLSSEHKHSEDLILKFKSSLSSFKAYFENEISNLKDISEWDRFVIAFFGETNAGKSTIIESLRLLGDEEKKIEEKKEYETLTRRLDEIQNEIQKKEEEKIETKLKIESHLSQLNIIRDDLAKIKTENKFWNEEILTKERILKIKQERKNVIDLEISKYQKNILEIREKLEFFYENQNFEIERLNLLENSVFFKIKKEILNFFGVPAIITKTKLKEIEKKIKLLDKNLLENEEKLKEYNSLFKNIEPEVTFLTEDFSNAKKSLTNSEISIYDLEELNAVTESNLSCLNTEFREIEKRIFQLRRNLRPIEDRLENVGDGLIIGTGKQDFTTESIEYNFKFNGVPISLIDVPGIEGDEKKYQEMIKNAVAKAHLVFYVNGGNKKPESNTLEKIKEFLCDQTEVYSIINVKGKADSYEEPEERESLINTHKDLVKNKELTENALQSILQHKYVGNLEVHGLLAFSALSNFINFRRKDLIKSKQNFLKYFENHLLMKKFSNIDDVKNKIVEQAPAYKSKIKKANINKIICLLDKLVVSLENHCDSTFSDEIIQNIENEISNYLGESESELNSLRLKGKGIASSIASIFVKDLKYFLHLIIDKNKHKILELKIFTENEIDFSNEEALNKISDKYCYHLNKRLGQEFNKRFDEQTKYFSEKLEHKRQNFSRKIDFITKSNNNSKPSLIDGTNFNLNTDLTFKDFFDNGKSFLWKSGGAAFSGAALGSFIPGVGNVIGGVVGGVIGAILFFWEKIFGGQTKEAKLKADLIPKLKEIDSQIQKNYTKIVEKTIDKLKYQLDNDKSQLENGLLNMITLKNQIIDKSQKVEIRKQKMSEEINL